MGDLLDTNVVSEINKPRPNSNVLAYFFSRPIEQLFLIDVSVVEIRFGIIRAVDEKKERHLKAWLSDVLYTTFFGRVLPVTQEILLRWRILMDHGRRHNRTYSQPDLFLAATALEHNLTLVTRNTRDLAGIPGILLLNPREPTRLTKRHDRTQSTLLPHLPQGGLRRIARLPLLLRPLPHP